MRTYLLRLKTYGLKNLEHEVCLDFANATIPSVIDPKNKNVKAIYGLNGAGKSALMASVDLGIRLLINRNYLQLPSQSYLDRLFNQKKKHFHIEFDYALCDSSLPNKVLDVFSYSLDVVPSSNGYKILEEKLSIAKGRSLNEKFEPVFTVHDGVLTLEGKSDEGDALLLERTKNLLSMSTLSSLLHHLYLAKEEGFDLKGLRLMARRVHIGSLLVLATNTHVYVEAPDLHKVSFMGADAFIDNFSDMMIGDKNDYLQDLFYGLEPSTQEIKKDEMAPYEEKVRKLSSFIKIFNADLKDIEIKKKVDGDTYHCSLLFVYDGYKVDSEFESTGTKKLIELFSYFEYVSEGGTVFLDELDSNLHDVYLCKLIEYFSEYAKGQLCFTTHNLGPMEALSDKQFSLDFLGIDNHLVSWVKNGNYSPMSQYPKGMIKYSPFNFEAIDFLAVFGDPECK